MSKRIKAYDIYQNDIYDAIRNIGSLKNMTSPDMAAIANLLVLHGFLKYPEDDEDDDSVCILCDESTMDCECDFEEEEDDE